MTYTTTKLSRIDGDSVGALTTIPTTLAKHGITTPPKVAAAIEKHAEILEHITSISDAADTGSADETVARALANGEGTPEQLTLVAASRMIAVKTPNSPYRMIIKRARHLAATDLQRAYAEHGNAWITKTLRPALHAAVSQLKDATAYSPKYDAFLDPRAADHTLTNPAVHTAWATIRDIYQVARTLRRYRVIPAPEACDDLYEWSGNGNHTWKKAGDELTASIRDNLRADNLTWFLMAIQHGMEPTLLTADELNN